MAKNKLLKILVFGLFISFFSISFLTLKLVDSVDGVLDLSPQNIGKKAAFPLEKQRVISDPSKKQRFLKGNIQGESFVAFSKNESFIRVNSRTLSFVKMQKNINKQEQFVLGKSGGSNFNEVSLNQLNLKTLKEIENNIQIISEVYSDREKQSKSFLEPGPYDEISPLQSGKLIEKNVVFDPKIGEQTISPKIAEKKIPAEIEETSTFEINTLD